MACYPGEASGSEPSRENFPPQVDSDLEVIAQRLLRILNGYSFGQVDVDVWRNVYQHYLPAEERQRIGGFYTPDELVNLVLDLAEYSSTASGLCELSFLDPLVAAEHSLRGLSVACWLICDLTYRAMPTSISQTFQSGNTLRKLSISFPRSCMQLTYILLRHSSRR